MMAKNPDFKEKPGGEPKKTQRDKILVRLKQKKEGNGVKGENVGSRK